MRVLNLVTNDQSRFFAQQTTALEERGVESSTVSVPSPFIAGDGRRSVIDYLRLLPPTVRRSFGEYDLIHANSGLTAPAAVLQPNLPTVVSLWGTDLMGRYGPVTELFSRQCDAVVVMSDEMSRIFGGDCHVIPHGVDLDKFSPTPQEAAAEDLGWSTDVHQVLFPYPPERGVKEFPRAASIVAEARSRLEDPVVLQTVTGVPHAAMPTYMNAADLLLLTSRREGSPNSVKEALACNLPVVATPVGDVPERLDGVEPSAVADGDRELVDAVVDTLRDGSRSNGREHAAEVSVDRMTDRLVDVYRTVADSRVSPSGPTLDRQ